MVKLGDILHHLGDIEAKTLRVPTHIVISQRTANELVTQYNEFANGDADLVFEQGEKAYTIRDVGDFLGVQITLSINNIDDFKVLEEITPNS